MPWRSASSDRDSSRDTCIWLIPTRAAISVWVRPSKNRSRRIVCSRSGSVARRSLTTISCSTWSMPGSSPPSVSPSVRSSPGSCASSDWVAKARFASIASSTASGSTSIRAAISATVGERPSSFVSSPTVAVSRSPSSCSARGTRTDQDRSRKWRLISPEIVGVANVENARPRSGSKRSTALRRPSVAICSRSSTASPRPAKRRASAIARPRCSEISSSRSRRSLVRRYSKNRASGSSGRVVGHPSGTRLNSRKRRCPSATSSWYSSTTAATIVRASSVGAKRPPPSSAHDPSISIASSRSVKTRFSVASGRPR